MTRVRFAAVAALLIATPLFARVQDWRDTFLATFDVVWQTVRETHFDPAFGGVDWDAVRTDLRPKMVAASSQVAGRQILDEMLGRLKQSHFTLMTNAPSGSVTPLGEATVLVEVRATAKGVIVTRVQRGSRAALGGLRAGDRLVSVDGAPIASPGDLRTAGVRPDAEVEAWLDVIRQLSGNSGSIARLRLERPDRSAYDAEVLREIEPGELVELGNLPAIRASLESEEVRTPGGRRVGIISFNIWMAPLAEPFAEAIDRFRTADGLIVDLSGNVGGLVEMIRGVAGHVINEPQVLGRMQMRTNTLEFRANPRRATDDGRRVVPYSGPLAIVVDGLTASASECFAAGLQSLGRARVFGTPTMGQALPALTKTLPNGDVLMYAVGDFVTAGGRRIEGAGVVPDEVVPIDSEALAAGRDGRQRAISWIDQQPRR